ncbi:hypothetical protein [Rhizobium sp. AC27/96]|uniref:hypothetical protein n=1 Tax=Rhizobium sp. AC27/96 TaxID=1841653 RepID=UPI00114770B0|nr:hypothetical protein [Rhizobium sp. AC27/96]
MEISATNGSVPTGNQHAVGNFGSREWLVEFFESSGPVGFDVNEALELFAASCKVPPLPDGTIWKFTANQFRKFFATTHQWRYFFPDLPSLNYQLQQRDMNTTASYTKMQHAAAMRLNDTRNARQVNDGPLKAALERGLDMRDAELQFMKDLILEVHSGKIKAAGGGASMFREFEEALARQIDILSSSEGAVINGVLSEFVEGRHLTTHPEGGNLCKCGSSLGDKSVAGCLDAAAEDGLSVEHATGPDYSYATRETCFGCPNAIRLNILMPYWDAAYEKVSEASKSTDPFVREASKESLNVIASARSEFQ